MPEEISKTALLAGATGLVGQQVLQNLLETPYYSEVKVLTRRPLNISNPRLTEIITDFDKPDRTLIRADDIFCCLGTTIKKAGSQEAFKKVDLDYPVRIAEFAKINGAEKYLIVTAMGADTKSVFFYNRIKGEVQEKLAAMKFDSLHILQPSLLLGKRAESRLGEKIGEVFSNLFAPFMNGSLKKYKAIESSKVARAMVSLAMKPEKGIFIHDSAALQQY
ncbi:oxidoreductase [Dyadobacter flavalbus]|uniref:Oxidoreductase n=1 Tax=Dyadobacter flavalbus TaxID=2579942 RepID=A0A5M8QXP4_9BACT|nr:oxidoreductase [Dyadobacter flavalbus]KAA6439456.1 oxidoreductase [Dyadobacter flavalbus]